MTDKINCDYCNKLICKSKLNRHQNTKQCRNKQLNKDIILNVKEYICKYCGKLFNRLDDKNGHESSCSSKDMYYKFQLELEKKDEIIKQKNNEINIYKNEIIKQKDNEINYLKSQLQLYRPCINNYNDNVSITINNNININFGDIRNHLDKFNIHVLSDHTALIGFIMKIFKDKVKLTNECKQIMSYYMKDKMINDIKCKTFLSNSAGELCDISDRICQEELNKNILNDTIIKNACKNNILLNSISTEEGIKNGIRKKNPMILVHEIIKYLKENELTDIKGV